MNSTEQQSKDKGGDCNCLVMSAEEYKVYKTQVDGIESGVFVLYSKTQTKEPDVRKRCM